MRETVPFTFRQVGHSHLFGKHRPDFLRIEPYRYGVAHGGYSSVVLKEVQSVRRDFDGKERGLIGKRVRVPVGEDQPVFIEVVRVGEKLLFACVSLQRLRSLVVRKLSANSSRIRRCNARFSFMGIPFCLLCVGAFRLTEPQFPSISGASSDLPPPRRLSQATDKTVRVPAMIHRVAARLDSRWREFRIPG